jgi:drug/metabolite transporter (DMT)-like permease
MQESAHFKGFSLAIIASILWGISGTFAQFLFQQRGINVEWLITTRMLIAGFMLLLIAGFNKNPDLWNIWKTKKDAFQLVLFSITGILAVQYTYFAAVKYSNAATATILQYAGPVLIVIYLAFKTNRLPKTLEYVAILLAVLGTFLLVTHGNIHSLTISRIAFFYGIASAIALAIYTLQPIALLKKYSSTAIIGWGLFIGGVSFSIVRAPWNVEGDWDDYTYSYTSFIILFGTLAAFYFYLKAVQLIGGQKTSLLTSAEPLSATILAILWLKIPFETIDWIGGLCIISTVFLLGKKKKTIVRKKAEVKTSEIL